MLGETGKTKSPASGKYRVMSLASLTERLGTQINGFDSIQKPRVSDPQGEPIA